MIDCLKCPKKGSCCREGTWVDLKEAQTIINLKIKGEFHQLEKDPDFPSGWIVATSYGDKQCTFLDKDGLCRIHKIDFNAKPRLCREFPYNHGEISCDAKDLCIMFKEANA